VCRTFPGVARVDQTVREAVDQIVLTLGRFQQDRPAVRTRLWLIERGDERAIKEMRKKDSLWYGLREKLGLRFSVAASRSETLPVRGVPPRSSQTIERALGALPRLGVFSLVACR